MKKISSYLRKKKNQLQESFSFLDFCLYLVGFYEIVFVHTNIYKLYQLSLYKTNLTFIYSQILTALDQLSHQKRIPKKFKKLKNMIISSFQAKTGWEMPRKSENKNYRSDQFLPDQL